MKNRVKLLVTAALFAALVFVCTFISVPMPGVGGYIHLGDAVIYIAATLLPSGFAVASAAIGACFADIALGSSMWAPFTFVVKALMALCFCKKGSKMFCAKNVMCAFFAGIINIAGYYVAEGVLFGNFYSPVASVPFNAIQSGASMVLFIALSLVFDRVKNKNH